MLKTVSIFEEYENSLILTFCGALLQSRYGPNHQAAVNLRNEMKQLQSGIRDEMAAARSELQSAERKYNAAMDQWSKKEDGVVDEVLKSRDTLKKKLQN